MLSSDVLSRIRTRTDCKWAAGRYDSAMHALTASCYTAVEASRPRRLTAKRTLIGRAPTTRVRAGSDRVERLSTPHNSDDGWMGTKPRESARRRRSGGESERLPGWQTRPTRVKCHTGECRRKRLFHKRPKRGRVSRTSRYGRNQGGTCARR